MNFIKKYKHGLIMIFYSVFYLCCFFYLETRQVSTWHLIHCPLDDLIPFCEYFIIPYYLWFPYQIAVVCYFVFINKDKSDYYHLISNMIMGMTIFLLVSWVYPNMQTLRPDSFVRDNIFTHMVAALYYMDTPTNLLPSIHVFNSLAAHMSLTNCKSLRNNKAVKCLSFLLTASIILSTMFLKQHSVIDVTLGFAMAWVGYLVFYHRRADVRAEKQLLSRTEMDEM